MRYRDSWLHKLGTAALLIMFLFIVENESFNSLPMLVQ